MNLTIALFLMIGIVLNGFSREPFNYTEEQIYCCDPIDSKCDEDLEFVEFECNDEITYDVNCRSEDVDHEDPYCYLD